MFTIKNKNIVHFTFNIYIKRLITFYQTSLNTIEV